MRKAPPIRCADANASETAETQVEELYTKKTVELLVLATLHNPRSDMKRFWFMTPEAFFDRISAMREMWQKWMLEQVGQRIMRLIFVGGQA